MENELIRRLGCQEVLYDTEVQNGNFILSRVFVVHTETANEISLDLLKQACGFWIKRHPFLRAKIQRNPENETERFFVHMAKSDAFAFNNVEMLEEKRPSLTWRDVMDKEAIELFDLSKGPLWRIKWVKLELEDNRLLENANHALILTVQHSIGDGRNCYEIGVQLLNIVGALLENKSCVEMDESVVEHSLYSNDELAEHKKIQFEHEKDDHDHESRQSKLISGNADQPEGRFQLFCLESSKMKKLLTAVKTNSANSKLASVLATVLCIAWRNLFKKIGVEDIPLNRFQYVVLASIREKLGVANTQMGLYSSVLHATCNLSDQLCLELENERLSSFWRLCDDQSTILANKLKRNEEFTFYTELEDIAAQLREARFNNQHLNFALSNMGVMRNTACAVVRIKEHYARMPCKADRIGSNPFVSVTSVDGNLCMGFSYNENMVSTDVMKQFVEEVKRFIDVIIK
jgi:hypothetical protein